MYENNVIANKSKQFAVRIVKLGKFLREEHKDYILSKQIVRSGTSIGANVREALQAQSRKDFVAKMNIALKEANETEYWIEILFESQMLTQEQFESISRDCSEINKILISIVKSTKT